MILLFYSFSFSVFSQECNKLTPRYTPTKNFKIQQNKQLVLDKKTGLIWQRCSLGLSLVKGHCTGNIKKYTIEKAKKAAKLSHLAGFKDWRVPTIKELASIAELACFKPAINTTIFPNTNTLEYYWSSSPYVGASFDAWSIDFYYGYGSRERSSELFARLVRVGQ